MNSLPLSPLKKHLRATIGICAGAAVLAVLFVFVLVAPAWPEFSDREAPELKLEGIATGGKYTGALSLTFTVHDEASAVERVLLAVDGKTIFDKVIGQKEWFDGTEIDTTLLAEGEHQLLIMVEDGSLWRKRAERTIVFSVDHTAPGLSVKAMKDSVFQGDTGGLVVKSDEPLASLSLEAGGKLFTCYALSPGAVFFRGLFPVSPLARPAVQEVVCLAHDLAGNETRHTEQYLVRRRDFVSETIALPKEKRGILKNVPKISEDRKKTEAALAAAGTDQLWRGTFLRPAAGVDSSAFGTRRVYETGGVASWHHGIDIANQEGTPITADNRGRVLLAEELFVTGNTVILDHGAGVVSFYFHMRSLSVKKDDLVAQGGLLGRMGTTGLSTGNHCHWEVQVAGESVNPDDWLKNSFEPAED